MNYLVIAIIVALLIGVCIMGMSESYTNQRNSYASLSLPLSLTSPSCMRTKNYTNIYDGYQMAPPVRESPCSVATEPHYRKLNVSYPADEPVYDKECKDGYRCRVMGVATGVQGKIM
jgi:hypothetical protein